jgi:hypothetical protein
MRGGGTGTMRRRLSLVNPVAFHAVADCVSTNWTAINHQLSLNTISQSRPMYWAGASRAFKEISYSNRHLVAPKARHRSSARAFLITDLSQFYHSIYTHSIGWAFHTKAVAKANHSQSLFGNRLDALVQRGQQRQTFGIPIGPDTSLVIAEGILAEVERNVLLRLPNFRGVRFIDDYELCFSDSGSAENALTVLQEELQQFELQLNPKKTRIVAPPIRFEPEWVSDFRTFSIRSNSGQQGDLVRYFDLITKYVQTDPEAHVAKYAMSKLLLPSFVPLAANNLLYQSLLCQLLLTQPSAAKEIVGCLLLLQTAGLAIDVTLVTACFAELIRRAAPLAHHYELSWVLYAVLRLHMFLDAATISILGQCDNAVIALMSLNASAQGLAPGLDTSRWVPHLTANDLHDEFWILSYEANRLGWMPPGHLDYVAEDTSFSFMRANGVAFYTPI